MTHAFTAIWQDAVARVRPRRSLLIGPGADGLAASVLAATAAWEGLVDLAWPVPAEGQPPAEGSRFTLHRGRPQDAAGLLPVPDLVLIESAEPRGAGATVAGVLNAVRVQARRGAEPYPLVLLFGASVADDAGSTQGAETRPPALAALEDFAAAEAPALVHAILPLLGGVGVLAGREAAEREAVRAVISGLSMGRMARAAAAEAEAARLALLGERVALQEQCRAAAARTDYLYAAIRRGQLAAAAPAELREGGPDGSAARAPRRAVGKLLSLAGLRELRSRNPEPDDEAAIARLRRSPVLSEAWYLAHYPDVAASGMDPAEHYFRHGAAEGRDPGPDFSTAVYLASAPDAVPGINPLLHFLDCGGRDGRRPNPDFDPAFYLADNPDVAAAGLNPLEHFVAQGRAEGRRGLPGR